MNAQFTQSTIKLYVANCDLVSLMTEYTRTTIKLYVAKCDLVSVMTEYTRTTINLYVAKCDLVSLMAGRLLYHKLSVAIEPFALMTRYTAYHKPVCGKM